EDSDPGASRPAAIFLHGAGGNTVGWWQQIPAFVPILRCIAYDIRGYGRSPNPTGDSMTFLIADLEALVAHLCLTRVVLIAQSMGGRAALGYAVRHPDTVLALIMADNWGSFHWPEHYERAKQFTIPEGHPRGVGRNFPQEQPALYHLFRSIGGLNPPRPRLEGPTPGGPTVEEVQRLEVPVLCIVGADDVIFPPSQIRAFAELLPNSVLGSQQRDSSDAVCWEQDRSSPISSGVCGGGRCRSFSLFREGTSFQQAIAGFPQEAHSRIGKLRDLGTSSSQ
ncbi:rutD, partial [Symbiodinium pilosum]